jgi:regulator of sigma E protease
VLSNFSGLQWVLAILGLGFVVAWHEFGHYIMARLLGMTVRSFSVGFGPRVLGIRRGGIDYRLSAIPFGGFVDIKGMTELDEDARGDPKSFINHPRWARVLVLVGGPAFNYLAAFVAFMVFFGGWPSPLLHPVMEVVEVVEGGAAAEAGLARGDMITAINGNDIADEEQFRAAITSSAGAALALDVMRVGEMRKLSVTPRSVEGGYRLGIAPYLRAPSAGVVGTVTASVRACWLGSQQTLGALAALVRRDEGVEMGGPIAIVADMKDKLAKGMRFFVMIFALLHVNVGLFNLLPIPGLDGSKITVLGIESVLRRNVSAKAQLFAHAAGMLLMLSLMGFLFVRDAIHLGTR